MVPIVTCFPRDGVTLAPIVFNKNFLMPKYKITPKKKADNIQGMALNIVAVQGACRPQKK